MLRIRAYLNEEMRIKDCKKNIRVERRTINEDAQINFANIRSWKRRCFNVASI